MFILDGDFTEEDFKEMMITIKVKEFDPKYFYKQAIQQKRIIHYITRIIHSFFIFYEALSMKPSFRGSNIS